ncbi:MAG: recombinase family protein [Clostridia bacterium]|nr:recombinase family protein [Clostridia bacterium]
MPQVTVIESTPAPERAEAAPKPRRVAAYARVSTEKDEQQTSYEAQRSYYTRLIASRPDWTLAGVYADEYSGTGTKKRDGFRRMIEDALAGGIDLIVTKSVARFARNTVDSLTHIRLLREHGTEVYFEKENIRTFDENGELMLTILSSLAQEESRSISENVTWGMRESMRRGNAWVPYKSFLGYDRAPDGSMAVNPEQAAVVRRVYGLFLAGLTPYGVARTLEGEGVPFAAGREKWYASTVLSILRNEKYKGDALRQKTYSKSYLTKERAVNNGELRKYYIAGHHEAIVSPAVFDLVQRELKEREGEPRAAEGVFARRVFCAECGGVMGRFTRRRGGAETRSLRCSGRKCGRCSAPPVPEEELKAAFAAACAARFDVSAAEAACAEAVSSVILSGAMRSIAPVGTSSAPSEEGAVEGGGTPSETEGEITPSRDLQGVISEDGGSSFALAPHLRNDASAKGKLPVSLPPSCLGLHLGNPPSRLRARSGRGSDSPPGCHSLPRPPLRYLPEGGKTDALRKAGDPPGFALGMTPHPSPPSATPPSPQGEGLADRLREEGDSPGEAPGMTETPALPSPPPFDETLFRCVVERVTVSRAETVFTFRDGSAAAIPRP